jgi:hypothetical protein
MRSQLRIRVFLPVIVLGLLGAGFGAFTFTGPSGTEEAAALASATPSKQPAAKAAPAKPASKPSESAKVLTPLQQELAAHRAVVVVFYTPGASLDALTTLEARAGAAAAGAGFLAVDVSKESAVAALAKEHELRAAPGILVVTRGPDVVVRFDGFEDRETIAQAAANAVA